MSTSNVNIACVRACYAFETYGPLSIGKICYWLGIEVTQLYWGCGSTRWFKYDRDKLWLVYTQISPGHIWTTLYSPMDAAPVASLFLFHCTFTVSSCRFTICVMDITTWHLSPEASVLANEQASLMLSVKMWASWYNELRLAVFAYQAKVCCDFPRL
jgi:hypothetical protein